jgi:uncharacterized membrane protein required for colicin V production
MAFVPAIPFLLHIIVVVFGYLGIPSGLSWQIIQCACLGIELYISGRLYDREHGVII